MLILLYFALAVLSVSFFPFLPPLIVTLLLAFVGVACAFLRFKLLSAILIGICIGILLGYKIIAQQLPLGLEGQNLMLVGIVQDIPRQTEDKARFLFKIESVISHKNLESLLTNRTIQLSQYDYGYRHRKNHQRETPSINLKPGQRWQMVVRLKRPRGFVNPAGFDYQAYLLRRHIMATGYVYQKQNSILLTDNCHCQIIHHQRLSIQKILQTFVKDAEVFAVLNALAIGNTQFINQQQWEVFKKTGTIHLLAISGLHIGLAAVMGFYVGRVFATLSELLFSRFIVLRYFPSVVSIVFSGIYMALSGANLPAIRALIMVLVFHIGILFLYRVKAQLLFVVALLIIAIVDPLAMTSQGFWLSFLAVFCLLYGFCYYPMDKHQKKTGNWFFSSSSYIKGLIKAQWILAVGLLLPAFLLIKGISLTAPLVNLLAVPLVSLLIVPLLFFNVILVKLLGGISQFDCFLRIAFGVLESITAMLLQILGWFSQLSTGLWSLPSGTPGLGALLLGLVGVFCLLSPKVIRGQLLMGWFCFLPVFLPYKPPQTLRVTFMDVGQGTAVIVETAKHLLVYDTGKKYSDKFNVGEHIIAPYLVANGLSTIDKLIISHSDGDHAGGLEGLVTSISAQQVLSGQPEVLYENNLLPKHLAALQCEDKQHWQWDGVDFYMLWPNQQQLQENTTNDNNTSCVLLIRYAQHSILLTGDIEKTVEHLLLDHPLLPNQIDIMLAPHHGSNSSSSTRWLQRLQPRWTVVTAGYKNPYNHPHGDVLKRYQQIGSTVINTATEGGVRWIVTKETISVERWRRDYARYWY